MTENETIMERDSPPLGIVDGVGCGSCSVHVFLGGILQGARRGVMTSKRGNKNFYKGRGAKSTGRHTNKGGYMIRNYRIPEIIVPNLDGFKLKPYVSYKTPYIIGKPVTAQDILDITRVDHSTENSTMS